MTLSLCVGAETSAEERDDVHFDAGVSWKSGGLNGRACGLRRGEKRRVHVVHRGEVAKVGQVDRGADNLLKRGAARLQDFTDVLKHAPGLVTDAALDKRARLRIDGDLPDTNRKVLRVCWEYGPSAFGADSVETADSIFRPLW